MKSFYYRILSPYLQDNVFITIYIKKLKCLVMNSSQLHYIYLIFSTTQIVLIDLLKTRCDQLNE